LTGLDDTFLTEKTPKEKRRKEIPLSHHQIEIDDEMVFVALRARKKKKKKKKEEPEHQR
jgi:hypothetical protein